VAPRFVVLEGPLQIFFPQGLGLQLRCCFPRGNFFWGGGRRVVGGVFKGAPPGGGGGGGGETTRKKKIKLK